MRPIGADKKLAKETRKEKVRSEMSGRFGKFLSCFWGFRRLHMCGVAPMPGAVYWPQALRSEWPGLLTPILLDEDSKILNKSLCLVRSKLAREEPKDH